MVAIEPAPSTDVESKRSASTAIAAGREGSSSSSGSSSGDQANAAGIDSKNGDGYASEGFETASETEVADDEIETVADDDNNNLNDAVEHQEHRPVEVSVVASSKDQSFEDKINEDKLKQVYSFSVMELFGYFACFRLVFA